MKNNQKPSASLDGRVAIVTGGAKGIGRASALEFSKAGARVLVADIDQQAGQECVRYITDNGGHAYFQECDCTSPEQLADLVETALKLWGRLDFAHNNAGTTPARSGLKNLDNEAWEKVLATNLSSVFYGMRAQIPAIQASGGGAIVNTASTAGLRGAAGLSAYSASKHGVIGLTRSAALECAKSGIRVNAICPGAIETPLFHETFKSLEDKQMVAGLSPLGRAGEPQEVAGLVVWLCSDQASYVTGATMTIDGGMTAK